MATHRTPREPFTPVCAGVRLNHVVAKRTVLLVAGLALVGAACSTRSASDETAPPSSSVTSSTTSTTESPPESTAAPPTTTTPPPSQPLSTTTTPTGDAVPFDVATCEEPGDFDLFCEAYALLTTEYVDPLDAAMLAEGAARGIEEFADTTASEDVDRFVCQIPTNDFGLTCDAAAGALAGTDVETVAEAAIQGMLEFGLTDPNSVYLPPEALARIQEENSGEISGIGALVSTEEDEPDGTTTQCFIISETCRMRVVGLIPDAPAERGGMQVGDVTVTVDGESVLGWTSDEVVATVRGEAGSEVVLGIERDGEMLEFTIIRAPITIPVTTSEVLEDGVGYIALSQFTSNSGDLFRDELQLLVGAGVSQLVFDLRNNPGGALTASIEVASEFLSDGLVLRTESPEEDRSYQVKQGGLATDPDLEMVVLVNAGSASASEVVSSALQEAGRAIIMGEATFGKNTVQQQFGLQNGGAVKLTIARWVTPDGASFGGDGVQPDITVDVPPDAATDILLEEALAFLSA